MVAAQKKRNKKIKSPFHPKKKKDNLLSFDIPAKQVDESSVGAFLRRPCDETGVWLHVPGGKPRVQLCLWLDTVSLSGAGLSLGRQPAICVSGRATPEQSGTFHDMGQGVCQW